MLQRRDAGRAISATPRRWLVAISLLILLAAGGRVVAAQDSDPASFAGKTLTIINSNATGGAASLEARLYASFLPAYLPGRPTVIVRDMPGATNQIAWGYIYERAQPDGLTMCSCTNLVMPVLLNDAFKKDLTRYTWIGAIPFTSVLVMDRSVVASSDALLHAKGVFYGGTGASSASDLEVQLMFNALGVQYRYVLGFNGNAPIKKAILTGELNAAQVTLSAYHVLGYDKLVEAGSMLAVAQSGFLDSNGNVVADKRIALPTQTDLVKRLIHKPPSIAGYDSIMRILAGAHTLIRGVALPPDTPAPIANVMRRAFKDMFADSRFQVLYQKLTGVRPDLLDSTDTQRVVAQIAELAKAEPQSIAMLRTLGKSAGSSSK
jgi:tripartite-type tricarboxylate transporter receptor subunit TctC